LQLHITANYNFFTLKLPPAEDGGMVLPCNPAAR
jgi:hypothetical protein